MRYLILPELDEIAEEFTTEATPLQPASRAERLERLQQARRSAGSVLPDEGLLGAEGIRVLATPSWQTAVTGVTLVETDNAVEPERLNEAFPNHRLVEDFPLELIAPPAVDAAAETDPSPGSIVFAQEALWHLDAIGLRAARNAGLNLRGEGVTVEVLDTGVALVAELAGRIVENRTFDQQTWQYLGAPIADTHWHGTHVAGIIAGSNIGIAPAARILSLTMLPNQVGSLSHYVFALEYAATQPEVQILNISAGKIGQHPQMRNIVKIVQRLDILSVIAIGNEGMSTSRSPGNYPEVISVGASAADGTIWDRSGGGTVSWDGQDFMAPTLVAPGVDLLSCIPDGTFRAESGTSMAAPVVTGLATLLIGKHPDITVKELRDELVSSCIDLNLDIGRQGAGMVRLPQLLLS